jgi:hypothetical protein
MILKVLSKFSKNTSPLYFVKENQCSAVIRTFEGKEERVINHTQHVLGFDKVG